MKFLRFEDEAGVVRYGVLGADGASAAILAGNPFAGTLEETGETAAIGRLLPPVAPAQIIGIGLNYRRHAAESNLPVPEYPVVFFKNVLAAAPHGAPIRLPKGAMASEKVDYECELAVVIGKACRGATRENALSYVLGYTCANDVSARDWQMQKGGSQWSFGKSFDTFCPLGPVLTTADEIPDPNALRIRTELNGETVQDESTGDMIFDVPTLIAYLSGAMTLPPGTVILTGPPQGVGMAANPPRFLRPGDTVTIEVEGIGRLTNPVE